MRRSIAVLISFLMITAAISVRAQVSESATGRRLKVYAGGEGTLSQPNYAGLGVAQAGPRRLMGIGAYVDAEFSRWVGIEAEGRWNHWHQYAGVNENTYMIGPRVPIVDYKGLRPYGKFLFGMGSGSFLNGRTTAWAYGGGVDYRLNSKFTVRLIDMEFQTWRVVPTLHPYGGSIGLSYRVF